MPSFLNIHILVKTLNVVQRETLCWIEARNYEQKLQMESEAVPISICSPNKAEANLIDCVLRCTDNYLVEGTRRLCTQGIADLGAEGLRGVALGAQSPGEGQVGGSCGVPISLRCTETRQNLGSIQYHIQTLPSENALMKYDVNLPTCQHFYSVGCKRCLKSRVQLLFSHCAFFRRVLCSAVQRRVSI